MNIINESDDQSMYDLHDHLVKHYGHSGSNHINNYTRGSKLTNTKMRHGYKSESHNKKVHDLHVALKQRRASKTFYVHTGLPKSPISMHEDHHGTKPLKHESIKVHNKAFMSTSISEHIADSFAVEHKHKHGSEKHVMRIRIPKNSQHGRYVAHESHYKTEYEFLLNHGKNLRIHPIPKVKKKGLFGQHKVYYWDAEIDHK